MIGIQKKRHQSIVFEVWLPDTHPTTHTSTLTLKNPNALYFFLEALARGHTMFFGQPFEMVAMDGTRTVGMGTYTVQYANTSDREHLGVVDIDIGQEEGILRNFMIVAWHHMHDANLSRKRNATIEDVFGQ